jgi:hypothetical protein
MGKVRDIYVRLSKATEQVTEKAVLVIMADNESVITQRNTDQLFEGRRSDGSSLPDYSKTSVNVFGKPQGPIRLFDKGDFYDGFFVDAKEFPVLIGSKDEKTNELTERYGQNIFGLERANLKDTARAYILPSLGVWFKKLVRL